MANQSEINEAFWRRYTSEASEFFINKMLMLAPREELRGSFLGHDAPNHLMYKVDTLYSNDGHRAYEFLIEYDIYEPNVGIYYGCKGLTLGSCNHEDEIAIFNKEWEILRPEVCAVLNNTFPGKCFNHRFKLTNNANNNTYWPFWITLQEDEDILEVGLRAVRLIRNVYKRFIDSNDPSVIERREMPKPNTDADVTAFTEAAYQKLKEHFNVYNYRGSRKELNNEATIHNHNLLDKFLSRSVTDHILSVDENYEKAWRYSPENQDMKNDNLSFIRYIHCFFQYMYNHNYYKRSSENEEETQAKATIPWKEVTNMILNSNGERYGESLRTQCKDALKRKFQSEIEATYKRIEILLS